MFFRWYFLFMSWFIRKTYPKYSPFLLHYAKLGYWKVWFNEEILGMFILCWFFCLVINSTMKSQRVIIIRYCPEKSVFIFHYLYIVPYKSKPKHNYKQNRFILQISIDLWVKLTIVSLDIPNPGIHRMIIGQETML